MFSSKYIVFRCQGLQWNRQIPSMNSASSVLSVLLFTAHPLATSSVIEEK